jgi:hypothetical protein
MALRPGDRDLALAIQRSYLVHQLRTAECKVQTCAGVEDHFATVGVHDL